VFKNALVILITFQLAKDISEIGLLITLAAGVFILPFFLFSASAGKIAESYNKTWLIRKIKLAEIFIMLTGAVAFLQQNLVFLFTVLFLMGIQSAFFGPIKYAILPEKIAEKELLKANGWFSSSTFVAILLGTILGGFLIMIEEGNFWVSVLIVALACLGYLLSLFVTDSITPQQKLSLSFNFVKTTWQEINYARHYPQAFFSVLAISWFWFLGATYLSQIPVLVKQVIFANDEVVQLFLLTFTLGIALGAMIVNYLNLKVKKIRDIVWLATVLIGISVAMGASNIAMGMVVQQELPLQLVDFIYQVPPLVILLLMAVIAVLGGIYIVPLYTLLQIQTPKGSRSRVVAVNNITNTLFMLVSALLIMLLYVFDWELASIFILFSGLNLLVSFWFFKRVKNEIVI
jgi:MFS family permease